MSGVTLAGLAAVLPLIGSIWLVVFVYGILVAVGDKMLLWFLKSCALLMGEPKAYLDWQIDFFGANLLRLLLPLTLLFVVGLVLLARPSKRVVSKLGSLCTKFPLVGTVYAGLEQFVDALREIGRDHKFKSVVYVEYPSKGYRLLGFVTGNYSDTDSGEDVTSVFIPTSPNPMTGFLVIVDDAQVVRSNMTVEQASKMVLSAGLVTPGHPGEPRPYKERMHDPDEGAVQDS